MDAEPTGHTIDGTPWEEPRPPHLPDTLTRVSPWVFPFVLLTGVQVVAAWLDLAAQGDLRDARALEFLVLTWLPGVCASLLGAALFYRHPGAHRRLPMVTMGVVLLAFSALMQVASEPLDRALMDATPATEASFLSALFWHEVYRAAITVVRLFGLVYVARGLVGARRFADVVSGPAVAFVVVAVAAVLSVISLASAVSVADLGVLLTPINLASVVLAKINTLAWVYLFVIGLGGWLVGERPRIGWVLVAFAAAIEVIYLLVTAVGGLLDFSLASELLFLIVHWLGTARWILLLMAFAVGVPSTAPDAVDDGSETRPTADPQAMTRSGSGAG